MPTRAELEALADSKAAKYGIDPAIFRALVEKESGWNPNARGAAGEYGLGQLMPGTAQQLGVTNPLDPDQNLDAAAKYLGQQYQTFGNYNDALNAYNGGPGNRQAGAAAGYANDVLRRAGGGAGASGPPSTAGQSNPGPSGILGAIGGMFGSAIGSVGSFFWNVFTRVVVILIGIVLVWQGLAMMRGTTVIQQVKDYTPRIPEPRAPKAPKAKAA